MRRLGVTVVIMSVLVGCGGPEPGSPGEKIPTTPVALQTLEGEARTLEEFRGQIVVLNFWATWCPPCLDEIPDLVALHEEYQDRGVVVVGVSMDVAGASVVKPFLTRHGVTYPIRIGNRTISSQYRVIGIPVTFILDREGQIVERFDGPYRKQDFEQALQPLL
jgi:cytochrome c biogenesis protein CcmG, thiol:disulfide interchange protein DsbE